MYQLYVCIYPLPLGPPITPHPTCLGHHRTLCWIWLCCKCINICTSMNSYIACIFSLMTQSCCYACPLLFCAVMWCSGGFSLNAWTITLLTWGSLLLLYSRAAMLLVVPNILSFTSTLSFFNVLFLIHCGLGIQVTQLVRIDPNLRVNAPKQASVPPSEFLWESILQVRCNQF